MSRKRKPAPKAVARPLPSEPARIPAHPVVSRPLRIALRVTGFLLLAAALLAGLHPELRVWGIHHLAFLPKGAAAGLLLLTAALWSPLGPRFAGYLVKKLKPLANRSALWYALAAALLFFLLRVSVPLLGDGPLWIKELAWIGEFEARGRSVSLKRSLMRKEPLELGLHELVFRATAALNPPSASSDSQAQSDGRQPSREQVFHRRAHAIYVYLSVIAGAFFVWMLVRFARQRLAAQARAPFLLLMFSGGGVLLFFGYVENYTWASLTMTACLLAGLSDAFPPRRFPWRTIVALVVAASFHLMSFLLLPAVAYLLYSLHITGRETDQRSRFPMSRTGVFLIATGVAVLAGYLYVKGWKGWMSIIPLLSHWSRDGYAAFSLRHALDLVNLLALAALPALVILLFSRGRREKMAYERTQIGFLQLAAFCGLLFAALFNPNLGMARDWDLLAAALWPVLVWGAWTTARQDFGEHRAEFLAGVAGFVVLIAVPFILVSTIPAPSLARYETLLHMDRSRSAYGWENLAIYYESVGDVENRIRAWRTAAEVSDNPRYKLNLSIGLRMIGRLEEAEIYCVQAASKQPKFAYQLAYLAEAYLRQNRADKARELLTIAAELDSSNAQFRHMLQKLDQQLENVKSSP